MACYKLWQAVAASRGPPRRHGQHRPALSCWRSSVNCRPWAWRPLLPPTTIHPPPRLPLPHAVERVSIKDMVYFDRGHGSRAPDSNDTRGLINQIDKSRFRQIHCSILVQAQCISQAARNRAEQARRDTAQRAETQQVRQFCAHLFKGIWDCPLRLK